MQNALPRGAGRLEAHSLDSRPPLATPYIPTRLRFCKRRSSQCVSFSRSIATALFLVACVSGCAGGLEPGRGLQGRATPENTRCPCWSNRQSSQPLLRGIYRSNIRQMGNLDAPPHTSAAFGKRRKARAREHLWPLILKYSRHELRRSFTIDNKRLLRKDSYAVKASAGIVCEHLAA